MTPETPVTPLPAEGFGSLKWWKGEIDAAEEKIAKYKDVWQRNVQSQIGTPLSSPPTTHEVVVPLDHANVEQKKALLYFRNPDVQLVAAPGHDAHAQVLQAFSAVVNEHLGPDGVDAESMMDEMLTDVLCPSGIGVTVLGMDVTVDGTQQVQVGEQMGIDGITPEPIMAEAPNIIHQAYFWSRVSPLMALLPPRFHGSNFDRAPWLGYRFEMDKAIAQQTYNLTDAEASAATDTPVRLNTDEQPSGGRDTDVVYGYCLSYKGSLYQPAVKHPEEIWRIVLLKGVNRVITHDRPYQQYGPDGRTLLGVRGHFIHVYTPRYISDSAIPPSDVSMSREPVKELEKGRTQMIQQRDRSRPMRQININSVDPDQAEKIKRGEYQEILLGNSNEPIVQEVARATFPRENFEFNRIIKADISEAWGLGDSQRGIAEESRRTATEISVRASGSDTKMEKERHRLLRWYLKGAEKLAGLIQLFEDDRTTVQIAGEANAQQIVQWKKQALPLRFQCHANMDTMIRVDTARAMKDQLDFYSLVANDPNVNRIEVLTKMARLRGYDTSKLLVTQLPAPKPAPPSLSIAIKGEDLNPTMPQFPIVQQLLTGGGVTIDPANIELGLALAQKQQLGMGPGAPGPVAGVPTPDGTHGGAAVPAQALAAPSPDTGKLDGMGMAQTP